MLLPARSLLPLLVVLLVLPAVALADGSSGSTRAADSEVRATGSCAGRAKARIRIRDDGSSLRVRFQVDGSRTGAWRVVFVHEGRVAWRGTRRTTRAAPTLLVERRFGDYRGADRVMVRGSGPRGVTCVASATLPG